MPDWSGPACGSTGVAPNRPRTCCRSATSACSRPSTASTRPAGTAWTHTPPRALAGDQKATSACPLKGGPMELPADGGLAIDPDQAPVHRWRVSQLIRLGIPRPLAEVYAERVDWHQIAGLVQRGCPPRLALRIVG